MVAATRDTAGWTARFGVAALLAGLCLLVPAPSRGQEEVVENGLFITIPHRPNDTQALRAKVQRNLQRNDRPIRKIIFDFNPDNRPNTSDDYGLCRNLAELLLEIQQVNTVAFVHNDVSGHLVLPVLACNEIVMSRHARLGNVPVGKEAFRLAEDQRLFYKHVAESRRRSPAVVRKMYDRGAELWRVPARDGFRFLDSEELEQGAQQGLRVDRKELVLPAGQIGFYPWTMAEDLGLCKGRTCETRQDVAQAYQLPATSLREDPLDGRTPIARRLEIRGQLKAPQFEGLQRRLRKAVAGGANLLVLQVDCTPGGDPQAAVDFAVFLRGLRDDLGQQPVLTVAYIAGRAPDAAAILALGCTEIIMAPQAEFGDCRSILYRRERTGVRERREAEYKLLREAVVQLAEDQGYPALVVQGLLDIPLTLYRVKGQKGPVQWHLLTAEQLEEDQAGERRWGNPTLIKARGQPLVLNATLARELGIAQDIAPDVRAVFDRYDARDARDLNPDWLDGIALFLRHPFMAVLLIMIGVACLIFELKLPGVGLPGVIAAVCFILYFWAHSQQLAGHIMMLAILLFLLGLLLLGLEIFVLPGFGVPGVSGVILVLLSLALVTLEKKPETTQEWLSFGRTLGTFGLGLIGSVALALLGAWYLPHIPYANRLLLKPPGETEAVEGDAEEEGTGVPPRLAALLGAIGVAVTPLRPAGMVRFGDEFVDVVAESFVPEGHRVQVVEIEGHRVVVKEV